MTRFFEGFNTLMESLAGPVALGSGLALLLGALLVVRALRQSAHANAVCARDTQLTLLEIKTRLDLGDTRGELSQLRAAEATTALRERLLEVSLANQLAMTQHLAEHRTAFEQRQTDSAQHLAQAQQQGFHQLQQQLAQALQRSAAELGQRVDALTQTTAEKLKEIAGQVDRRLAEGFEKTTATFADVLLRLALIDEAQKRITALSGEVVGLQQILADKRSRGAFGEVQLASLVRNLMPESSFKLQHTLPNGKIADCVLFMPAPTGTLAIDAKFPLESYRRMTDFAVNESERRAAERQFKLDIRKHIRDIADKYIIREVTADGAVMFLPAEAIFAEIQAHHADLVDIAHAAHVWIVSPTTLWAVLNTACAMLKDAATREQVDLIQVHLGHLSQDFARFTTRLENLARHIAQAHEDVQKVNISARSITARFDKIERVDLATNVLTAPPMPAQE
jgi:DNA recombination protein RmuC